MIWALVLFLLSGCQRYSQWQYHHISQKQTDSTRILYRSKNPASGIDVEMMKSHGELTTYLQVHSTPLPSREGKAEVQIQSGDKNVTFWAHLHEGGQRIRLTDSLQTALISSLAEGNPVTLQLQGYRETIYPKHFEKVFQNLNHPPYKIPIHLPL